MKEGRKERREGGRKGGKREGREEGRKGGRKGTLIISPALLPGPLRLTLSLCWCAWAASEFLG